MDSLTLTLPFDVPDSPAEPVDCRGGKLGGRASKLTPEQRAEIVQLYQSGLKLTEVSERCGIKPWRCWNVLKDAGIPMKRGGGIKRKSDKDAGLIECRRCFKLLPFEKFYKSRTNIHGYYPYCVSCKTEYDGPDTSKRQYQKRKSRFEADPQLHKQFKQEYSQKRREEYKTPVGRIKALRHTHQRNTRLKANGGSYTPQEWLDLCARYGGRCLYCGNIGTLHVDHIIPVSHPGSTSFITNLQPLCDFCNVSKKNRTIDYRPDKSCLLPSARRYGRR